MQATDLMIAHSSKGIVPAQSYRKHIKGGLRRFEKIMESFYDHMEFVDYGHLERTVETAFLFHDLGKLCKYSQQILSGQRKGKMPNHTDAGTAHLLQINALSAWMVKCHHRGYDILGDLQDLRDSQLLAHRCPYVSSEYVKLRMKDYTNKVMGSLMAAHMQSVKHPIPIFSVLKNWESGLFMRIAMSIMVDVDHYDTAKHYGHRIIEKKISLKPGRRLIALEDYVSGLAAVHGKSEIKESVFQACRNSKENGMVLCKSEVGTGKTTALMAYALRQAAKHNKRRIFYCAPYTSIISQTVDVFRKALVLEGEQPELVIAEHHSQVDPEEGLTEDRLDMMGDDQVSMIREFAQTWQAPIVCTTAVQLFETMAGCRTGRLRKLHNIVGSIIVIDESHMSMRPELWPLALIWLKELVDRFGCFVVFASGSMVMPWNSEELNILLDTHVRNQTGRKAIVLPNLTFEVPSIVPPELSERTLLNETKRVDIRLNNQVFQNAKEFCDWMLGKPGSRVVVCNTIHNAAVIARNLQREGHEVLHISTALTPADRELVLEDVKRRLKNRHDWTLVATSCIEAGIDISFDHGFRENSSMMSVMQLAGRVNRYGLRMDSTLQVFNLNYENGSFTDNPEFYSSKQVFKQMVKEGKVGPAYCAEAFDRSLVGGCDHLPGKHKDSPEISVADLLQMEANLDLKGVADYFNIVSGDKRTIIIGERFSVQAEGRSIVKKCVQIYEDRLERWQEFITPSDVDGFYFWTGQYDKFLGYYAQFI